MHKGLTLEQLSTDTRQLYGVLNNESDLACVVIGAAFLDSVLANLLHANLRDSSISNKLLDSRKGGALSSLQARADLAYCLSLISKLQYQDTCKIGEIRNLFAHNHLNLSFNEEKVRELCNQLNQNVVLKGFDGFFPENPTKEQQHMIARNQFNLAVTLLTDVLILEGLGLKRKDRKVSDNV